LKHENVNHMYYINHYVCVFCVYARARTHTHTRNSEYYIKIYKYKKY